MSDFFAELRRRHIYRIGAGYVVVAWAIAQLIDFLSQVWALPDWVAQPVSLVLAIGFPVTLIVAWLIEGKAHEAVVSAVRSKATTVDWLLFGAVAVLIALTGYQRVTPRNVIVAAVDEMAEEVSDRLPNSVAILLFDNLSPNPDDAYFAAGVHESILNELAKIRDMNVIARTSVLRYADTDMSIPEIANELNVETVMEGSVRYAGDQVRVTAQLIDPGTGVHIWSEEYDRDLADIFAIQSDIAERIAMALEAELLPAERESIETPPTDSPDAYAAFLKAMAVARGGFGVTSSPRTRSVIQNYLDEAIELDPQFALAHAWKARVYSSSRSDDAIREEDWLAHKSEINRLVSEHAGMALTLDPTLGFAHMVLGLMHFQNWRADLGQTEIEQAIGLSPNDPMVLMFYAGVEALVRDRAEQSVRYMERVVELDPNSAGAIQLLGTRLHLAGRHAEAIEIFQECLVLAPGSPGCAGGLAQSEYGRGNHEAALDALRLMEQVLPADTAPDLFAVIAHGYGLLGQPEDARRIFEVFRELAANQYVDSTNWADAYMGIGDYDEALNQLNVAAEQPERIRSPLASQAIRVNAWSDPMLEQAEFVEARNRLAFR
jgi:TolB-like protein/Tfp pilus assembly protein PilF